MFHANPSRMEDDDRKALPRSAKHAQDLNQLGRSWFEQAREQSAREEDEFEAWRRKPKTWKPFNKRSQFGDHFED
jgi:hypothetical protein